MTPEQAAHETRDVDRPRARRGSCRTRRRSRVAPSSGSRAWTSTSPGAAECSATLPADVVVAAFVFFGPAMLHDSVGTARRRPGLGTRRRAAWAASLHAWAESQLRRRRRRELHRCRGSGAWSTPHRSPARRSSRAGAPSPCRTTPKALALHHMNALREAARRAPRRRGAHGRPVAVRGARRASAQAPVRRSAGTNRRPIPRRCATVGHLAEARTDRMFGRHLAVLDESEREQLVEALKAVPT